MDLRRNQLAHATFSVLLCVALTLAGCGQSGPQVAKVEGIVTLDGKPLEGAYVYFRHADGGRASRAQTDSAGHYTLNFSPSASGAIVGDNVVRITTFVETQMDDNGKPIPGTGRPEVVPAKYHESGALTATVAPRGNSIDFPLESGK